MALMRDCFEGLVKRLFADSLRGQGKLEQLDNRFNDSLKNNWGLETLVSVGESWMPAMLEQARYYSPLAQIIYGCLAGSH
eukprot:1159965-Pelagomonas_calceolata.AAC.8